jgi:hypothetical protein
MSKASASVMILAKLDCWVNSVASSTLSLPAAPDADVLDVSH